MISNVIADEQLWMPSESSRVSFQFPVVRFDLILCHNLKFRCENSKKYKQYLKEVPTRSFHWIGHRTGSTSVKNPVKPADALTSAEIKFF